MPSQDPGHIGTTLGANIRYARLSMGLTQRRLAERLDIDSILVSKWERGRHRPSDQNLMALAQCLGHSIAWFYTEHPDEVAA